MPKITYTAEEKENALRLCDEIGVQKASEETGITVNSLYAWRRKKAENPAAAGGKAQEPADSQIISKKRVSLGRKPASKEKPAEDGLIRLRIENESLKAQVKTLKNALRAFTENP